ncbi:CHC2 zinc finger domain-containing protein [Desulforudis sp. 1088]|uniref:CHC2 zinc finger domain-containing protein n=1 Tax=unclassified Candidatus Desulforudis TaxID=2635950 RepID=UPI003CE48395
MAGLSPVRRGRQWFVRCPFHAGGNERTPSLSVSPDGNLWFCFACGEGGDAISFIAKLRGVRPVEAARMIARYFDLPVDDPDPVTAARLRREVEARQRRLETLNAGWRLAWAAASAYYRAAAKANEATNYEDPVLMGAELEADMLLRTLESPDPAIRLAAIREVLGV